VSGWIKPEFSSCGRFSLPDAWTTQNIKAKGRNGVVQVQFRNWRRCSRSELRFKGAGLGASIRLLGIGHTRELQVISGGGSRVADQFRTVALL